MGRENGHGIPHLKPYHSKDGGPPYYYWNPPAFVRDDGIFKVIPLGRDYQIARQRCVELNAAFDQYLETTTEKSPELGPVKPMTAAWLAREFENSSKFSHYSWQTRKAYSRYYRRVEVHILHDGTMFGHVHAAEVTRQIAYSVYEAFALNAPIGAAKIATAWQAAYKYATLRVAGININPFTCLDKKPPRVRRQRWTREQLSKFIKAADKSGQSAVGRCALLCFELAQRPVDIRNLTWSNYHEDEGYFVIPQSKQDVEVRIPPTRLLAKALKHAKAEAIGRWGVQIGNKFICPTMTGKRWHKRNLAREVRRIAREIGLPEDIQLRDLRRTAATEAASAGATAWEMMAAGGWQNQASIRPYLVWTVSQAASFQLKREIYRKNVRAQSLEASPGPKR